MVLYGITSYRSGSRILEIFQKTSFGKVTWIPHFSSIINWTYRTGKGLLDNIKKINQDWIAIMDHSIAIGTKQVFVVLRIKIDIFIEKKEAITLQDCECIGVKITSNVTGENVKNDLTNIFEKAGKPNSNSNLSKILSF